MFKDRRFGKTHDLRTLLNLALSSEFEVGFAQAERAYALVLELVPPSARP